MNLFVGNLNPATKADGLRILFSEFGEVVSSKVIFDATTGVSRGFGFVEMSDRNQSFDAIDNLDCSFFEGNIISVKEAKQNNTKPGGGSKPYNKPYNKPFNRPFNKPRPRSEQPGNEENFNRY
jgi:RNA recognition motif-containing protein